MSPGVLRTLRKRLGAWLGLSLGLLLGVAARADDGRRPVAVAATG